MADQDFILAPSTVKVRFSVAPVINFTSYISLLTQVGELSGFSRWVEDTYAALPPERLEKHKIFTHVLYDAANFSAYRENIDIPDFLEKVRTQDPVEVRDRLLEHLGPVQDLIADRQRYLDAVQETLGKKYASKGMELDLSPFENVHPLLSDPPALLEFVAEHLQYMWETYIKDEWAQDLPTLEESVRAFSQLDYSGQTALEAARNVTGRDLTGIWDALDSATELIFVPSMHIGPYVSPYSVEDNQIYLIFGARVPQGIPSRSSDLSRSELLVRLNALADDTRLQILELLTQNEELCAQDIMNELNLSQSSASRHLRQLTATGYLAERRREVAKCYSLKLDQVDATLRSLKRFLRS